MRTQRAEQIIQYQLSFVSEDPGLSDALSKHENANLAGRSRRAPHEPAKPDLEELNLTLPLWPVEEYIPDALDQEIGTTQVVDGPSAVMAPLSPEQFEALPDRFTNLSLEVIAKLHAGLLWRQLELLLWTKGEHSKSRKEILDWIFQEYPHDALAMPFSFDLCCVLEELDPNAIRKAITERIIHIKQGAGHRIRASLH